ncbi:helix-turn-helix transcriptional regulator [Streptomyces sp. SM12]|uniref:helix-turn-helix domain-containing protein n=1 Tax=Streptomyces sp. SM12 TaxID=1071602 RepID=UPI0021562877|nr:helix-turn-helix transcriptional regulator [Streptomyces sp. SM12]
MLRSWRENAGLQSRDAATRAGWDTTRLSRVERGLYRVSADEVRELATLYGVSDEHATTEVAAAAELTPGTGWWAPYIRNVTSDYIDFIELESTATSIRTQHPIVIPGLLQTPGYAREILTDSATSPERAEMLVTIRQARRSVLAHPERPCTLHALVPEAAFHAKFSAGPHVGRDQLRHLLDVAGQPNIQVQVVPLSTHPAYLTKGPMTLLEFGRPWSPVASVDNVLGGHHEYRPDAVAQLAEEWHQIAAAALSVPRSRDLMAHHLERINT